MTLKTASDKASINEFWTYKQKVGAQQLTVRYYGVYNQPNFTAAGLAGMAKALADAPGLVVYNQVAIWASLVGHA